MWLSVSLRVWKYTVVGWIGPPHGLATCCHLQPLDGVATSTASTAEQRQGSPRFAKAGAEIAATVTHFHPTPSIHSFIRAFIHSRHSDILLV